MANDLVFCIPAVLRASVLDKTLSSFSKHCTPGLSEFDANICIDNAPLNPDCTADDVINCAKKYFKNVRSCIHTTNLGYPSSALHLMTRSNEPYVFWLEDDWEAKAPFNISEMLKIFADYTITSPPLLQVRLPREKPMNDRVICTSPGIYSRALCNLVSSKLDTAVAFESQVKKLVEAQFGTRKCAITAYAKKTNMVVDIGRAWRKTRSIFKPNELGGLKTSFTKWCDSSGVVFGSKP